MSQNKRQAFLVSHTHWDREWYLPYNRFRVNLVEVVGKVLDSLENDPQFNNFVLDGQCAVLGDYLEAAPEETERVGKLIASGQLTVGPWFILPDEFLVSGEATVRNLIFGEKVTSPLGKVQKVGYMPDSFGHLAQIPQILNLSGIDSFIFTRGMDNKADELGWLFRWAAPDGSEVLAVNQCDGYCNAAGLGFEEIWHAHTHREVNHDLVTKKIAALFEKMEKRPGHWPALLNNGCDHFPPQQDFSDVLETLRKKLPDTEFSHGRFEDFLKAARLDKPDNERPLHSGELLGGRDHLILSGVWSARMYLKQENEICQNLICNYVEPLSAMTHFLYGDAYPSGLLDTAWRELLRNHPHDSICGCSTDSVHKDMDTRFAAVRQTGEQLLSRLSDRLTPMFARHEKDDRITVISVCNPLPLRRDEVVQRLAILQPLGYNLDNLCLLDEAGNEVPFRIVDRFFLERFWGIDYRAELFCNDQLGILDTYLDKFADRIVGSEDDKNEKDCFLHIQFLARDLPALGHRQYFLTDKSGQPVAEPDPVKAQLVSNDAKLENNLISVLLHSDGTFDLEDKTTGRTFIGLNLLEDTEDTGDEYDYSHAEIGGTYFSAGIEGNIRLLETTDLQATAEAKFKFNLPRSLERDRKTRQKRMARCDVRVRVTVKVNSGRVDVETDFNNHAFDHRLRAWFPSGIKTDTVVSDGHFMLNERPLIRPTDPDWDQPAPPSWPQQDFSVLQNDNEGLAIFNRGLPEFETWSDDEGRAIYAMTLLRCVDWLSRDDFPTRKCTNAGPTIHTPDAQCYGRHTFRYAVAAFAGNALESGIKDESELYRTEPVTHQGVADQMRPGGQSFFEKTNPQVNITAIKKAEKSDRLIVRLVNLSPEENTETLVFSHPVLEACVVDLLEIPLIVDCIEPSVTNGGFKIRLDMEPHRIVTLAIALGDPISVEETS
ncbi:MAG: hypothetical protein GY780_02165 [bacterium]|nr:hypothetical protein [bacterium]